MPYRIKIGDQQFQSDIEGTGEWSRSVSRDFNDRIFRTRPGYQFVGHEGLYTVLYNHMTIGGVCEALEGRIYFNTGTSWDYEWKGDILPQDFQFDLLKRNVEGQVLDGSWSSKFNNSQDSKVFLKAQRSKKNTIIASATSQLCDFFTPSTGAYDITDRECYRVFDVFTYLVDYYSDSTVTFTSTFFNTGGDGEQFYITTGEEIRTGENGANPEISFSQLFDEMNKKCNLWIVIEGTQDAPILRIEPQSYVFQNQLLLTVANPETLTMKTDLDQLYTIIKVGSSEQEYDPGNDADYITPRFYAWNDEEYTIGGDCEFENNTLDLTSSYRIDSNSLQKQIASVGSDEGDYDDDIFIVEIDPATQNAYQFTTDYTNTTIPYIYNYNLTNEQVILNWFNGLTGAIIKAIAPDYKVKLDTPATNGLFVPGLGYAFTSSAGGSDPFGFSNEIVDVNDVYTLNTVGGYRSGDFKPLVNGFYSFDGYVYVDTNTGSSVVTLQPVIRVYDDDAYTNLVIEYPQDEVTVPYVGRIDITEDDVWIPSSGIARIEMDTAGIGLVYFNDSEMVFTTADIDYTAVPDAPLVFLYDTARFQLSRTDFDTLDQGRGFVRILDTNANKKYDVWAKDVKYNSTTGVVEVGEFIGGSPPTELCWVLETGYWNDECYWLDVEQLVESETDWFIFTVDTTVAAKTNNDQFELPLVGSANILVDWGDGQVETGVTSTTTHTYGSTGTYTIKVAGTWTRFAFLTTTEDNDKMQTIEQWGVIGWGSMANAFFHCGNLTANYTDSPNVSNCSNFQQAFRQCTNFNGNVGGFDMSSATSLVNMFFNCTSFNNGGSDSIKDWAFNSVSGNISLAGCFYGCTSFNQPLTNWATNRVTTFSQFLYNCTNFDQPLNHFRFDICTTVFWMLRDCTSFDQNVEDWNMDTRPVGTYTDIMRGDTLSTANYDALLVGWLGWSGGAPTKTLPSNRTGVNFGNSTYSLGSDADDARDYLINTLSWAITDGGGV